MKKNAMSNQMIDLYLTLEGVTLKACDFEDDNNIKMMIPRRRHTIAEKKSADAKWRVSLTGKKNGRSREDYKTAKVMKAYDRSYNRYDKGGYDRHGVIKNRREEEQLKDALLDDGAWKKDVERFSYLLEQKKELEERLDTLYLEYDEILFLQHQFGEILERSAKKHQFCYAPKVTVISYVSTAVKHHEEVLASINEQIDALRKGVR